MVVVFHNKLTQFPTEIILLTNLTKLNLCNNLLTQLLPEIGKLTNLTELFLGVNKLKELPREIGRLTKLTKLDLGANELAKLPLEIGNLTKLKETHSFFWESGLNLQDNNFSLPDKILKKKDPKEIIDYILLSQGKIIGGEFFISVAIQRNLKESELAKITEWLNKFKIRAYFAKDKDNPDIKLSRKSEAAIHEIKQYISNKYQDYISQVYNQKTQTEE